MKRTSFFNKINYSACNEDSESERKALQLNDTDTVLCITGSGARALDLLIDNPKKIISVDFNVTQNYLLKLKIAAYRTLNYSEFISFVGLNDSLNKLELYIKVKPQLSKEVENYWDNHSKLIEKGLLYCGTWEKLLGIMSKATFFRKKMIKALMQSETIENQREFWNHHWDNTIWRFFLKTICNRFLWTRIIKEPGVLLIPIDFDIYKYLYSRLNYLANNYLLRSNHFANLMFYGKYQEKCLLPNHLREENFEVIKQQTNNIEIITDSLLNVIQKEHIIKQITAYSLSDFSSYADPTMYAKIWNCIANFSQVNTKFCERQFLVKRESDKLNNSIIRDSELEEALYKEDLTAIYTFCAGKIRNNMMY